MTIGVAVEVGEMVWLGREVGVKVGDRGAVGEGTGTLAAGVAGAQAAGVAGA
jgi:hypothetical protein